MSLYMLDRAFHINLINVIFFMYFPFAIVFCLLYCNYCTLRSFACLCFKDFPVLCVSIALFPFLYSLSHIVPSKLYMLPLQCFPYSPRPLCTSVILSSFSPDRNNTAWTQTTLVKITLSSRSQDASISKPAWTS